MGKKEEIGTRIRVMRKSRGMTQESLAKAICQSASSITMYETGRREPDFETLEALADVFNVPIGSLVDRDVVNYADAINQGETPKNDDIRLLVRGLNKLSPEQVAQAKNVFRAMFAITNPDLFEEGDDEQ